MKTNPRIAMRMAGVSTGILMMSAGLPLSAEPETGGAIPGNESSWMTLPTVTVIGSADAVRDLAGSGAYLGRDIIVEKNDANVSRLLQRVPGVYVREEDGFGNFPNISLRGVDPARSSKITIMEDGILTAPAPYSAPAAYYFPRAARMNAIEVLKGSSQVRYGPHTTGGVINFVSTPVPAEPSGYGKLTCGSDQTWLGHFHYGDTIQTPSGKFGWLLELFGQSSEGFRSIETSPGFRNPGDTGFDTIEPMLKLSWEPNAGPSQRFELKVGYTHFDANETYLGLTESDIRANPFRRYAATRYDNITSEQFRTYLAHSIEATDNVTVDSAAYYNRFERDWFKLDRIGRPDGTTSGLATALMNKDDVAILRGRAPGTFINRHNDRTYEAAGFQNITNVRFDTGSLSHSLDIGARIHYDNSGRDQFDEFFTQDAAGRVVSATKGAKHAAGWRKEEATALALFVEDSISIDRWTIRPGLRYEYIDYSFNNYLEGTSGSRTLDFFVPGVGLTYEATDEITFYGGVYAGVSVPAPQDYILGDLKEERSTSYELGVRYMNAEQALGVELSGFYTDLRDLLVINNIGGTGTGVSENVGDVDSAGLEFAVTWDPLAARGAAVTVPMYFAITYTHARIRGDAASTDAASIFSNAKDGNKVPYIPELALSGGIGLAGEKWNIGLGMTYVSETYTSADNVSKPTTDARFGKTDSALVFDLSAGYEIFDGCRLLGGVNNLFDETYLTGRLPQGPRNGAPRFYYVGMEYTF